MDFRIFCFFSVLVIYTIEVKAIKPTNLAKEVICEGCHAFITEANSLLGNGKRSTAQIRQALQNVCQVNRLTKYEFSPPNMVKACDYWKDKYNQEIQDVLSAGGELEDQEIQLCFVSTDACDRVDRSNFRINKYSGPSKKKIAAAQHVDEEVEEIDDEDELETGEDATIDDDEEVVEKESKEEEEAEDDESEETDEETDTDDEEEEKKSHKSKKGKKKGKEEKKGKGGKKDGDKKKDKGKKDGKKDKGKKDKGKKQGKDGKKEKKQDKHKKKGKKTKDEL